MTNTQLIRRNRMNKRNLMWMAGYLGVIAVIGALPESAFAAGAPWETPMQTAVGYITGTTGTLLATLGICIAGILFMIGKISWEWLASAVVGIALVFGSGQIVSIFRP